MNERQQIEFNRKMRELKESGLFPPEKRRIHQPATAAQNRYLIISYGGTGANALKKVKETFLRELSAEDMASSVRLLAIDTDLCTQDKFEPSEFFHLDNTAARGLISTNPQMLSAWMRDDTIRMIKNDPNYLDRNGASGVRQVGRLTLFPAATVESLQATINALINRLRDGTHVNLKVFILTGIAGGTGSGIVIDLTYLIRSFIEGLGIEHTTSIAGFVLLPSVGTSTLPAQITHGNSNGYAALKEINHFMGNAKHSGAAAAPAAAAPAADIYSQQFGHGIVRSKRNIFDICYLLDGAIGDIVFTDNPEEVADKVLADCILDMLTSFPSDDAQAVESFLSDAATFTSTMVGNNSVVAAPRDCDYVYCAIGHAEVDVPTRLIKTYVAAGIFRAMYDKLYSNINLVNADRVREFYNDVKVSSYTFNNNNNSQSKKIENKINEIFLDVDNGGPYYLINLLNSAVDLCRSELNRPRMLRPSEKQLNYMIRCFTGWNHTYFNIFTAVMDALSTQLKSDFKLITEGRFGVSVDGTENYTFKPIDLSAGDAANAAVKTYLDGLVNRTDSPTLARELLEDMFNNVGLWSQLFTADQRAGSFDGVKAVRSFWNTRISRIVDANVENFFVKRFYGGTGNADVCYDPNDPASVAALKSAAGVIYENMFGASGIAKPMIKLDHSTGTLPDSNFTANCYLFVPNKTKHLLEELQELATAKGAGGGVQVKVFPSDSVDTISAYSQYTSIPAFKVSWVAKAEPNYEDSLHVGTPGLHMSETAEGRLWKDFPNLIPKSAWSQVSVPGCPIYTNKREESLAQLAKDTFDAANKLGLAIGSDHGNMTDYTVSTINPAYRPNDQLYKDIEIAVGKGKDDARQRLRDEVERCAKSLSALLPAGTAPGNIVNTLRAHDISFSDRGLNPAGNMLSTTPAEAPSYPNWSEYIAGCMLRKLPDTMNDLRGTVDVVARLKKLLEKRLADQQRIKYFASYLAAGLFTYNEKLWRWEYVDARGQQQILCAFNRGSRIQKTAEYYFMIENFTADVMNSLSYRYDIKGAPQNDAEILRFEEFHASAAALCDQIDKSLTFDYANPDPLSLLASNDWAMAANKLGIDADAVREFHYNLRDTLASINMYGVII